MRYSTALCYTLPYYIPVIRAGCHAGGHAMWKVGTLVQPGFKPEDFFFNHFSPKSSQMLSSKEVLYSMACLYALFDFEEHPSSY